MINHLSEILRYIAQAISSEEGLSLRDNLVLESSFQIQPTLKELLIYHDLIPAAYYAFRDSPSIFSPEESFYRNTYYTAIMQCRRYYDEFLRIAAPFEREHIVIVPLKGIAFLDSLYKDKPFRVMTDIDVLVKKEALSQAHSILVNLGYQKELFGLTESYWLEKQCHFVYVHSHLTTLPPLEVHWSLDFYRNNREVLTELWTRLRSRRNDEGRLTYALSHEDAFFSLVLHNRRFGKPFLLKNIIDAMCLFNHYSEEMDWGYILAMSRKYAMNSAVAYLLSEIELLDVKGVEGRFQGKLVIPFLKRKIMSGFLRRNLFLPALPGKTKEKYLQSHFLLYDTLSEPAEYIFNIPLEQFGKFFDLDCYSPRARLMYKRRFWLFIVHFLKMVMGILIENLRHLLRLS
jgi:hypothetical protein